MTMGHGHTSQSDESVASGASERFSHQEVVSVEIRVYSKNLDLNSEAEKYIQKKLNKLNRHLKSISDAKVEVSRTSSRSPTDRILAQITLTTNRYILRGQERGSNLFAAVDAAINVMDRQIRRYKGKVYRSAQAKKLGRAGTDGDPDVPVATETEDAQDDIVVGEPNKVVKTKRFRMKPTTAEDAILQMELLNHDFFFFYNAETGEYNVAYRRQGGDYGIIEPELS